MGRVAEKNLHVVAFPCFFLLNHIKFQIRQINICVLKCRGCFLSVSFLSTDLSKNRLADVPTEVCHLVALETLNLYHNCIRTIPDSIIGLQSLTSLNLRYFYSQMHLGTCFIHLDSLTQSDVVYSAHCYAQLATGFMSLLGFPGSVCACSAVFMHIFPADVTIPTLSIKWNPASD